MRRQPREMLAGTLDRAMFAGNALALGGGGEQRMHGEPRAPADILKGHGGAERDRLHVLLAAAMAVDQPLWPHDLVVGDAVLVIAAVRAMHDEAPHPADPH